MKIVLFFLVLLNALFFGWSSWVAKTPLDLAVVTPEPDAPALMLFEEKFPERAQAERDAIEKIARDKRLAERAQREAEEAERLAKQKAADEEAARLAAEQAAIDDAARVAKEQTERDEADRLAAVAAQEKAARDEADRLAAVAAQEQADRDEAERVAAATAQELADRAEAERLAAAVAKAQADRDAAARLAVVAAQEAAASAAQTPPATVEVAAASAPSATRDQALDALNQLATEPQAQADGPLVVTADGPQEARCVRLGPFVQLRDAAKAAALLRDFAVASTQRNEEAQVWVGHWVHLPPAASRAAAVEIVEKLRADGVSDIYIEPSGERRHAISLGLFSDASRAEIRAGKIRKLGVTPQIRDRFRDGSVYWLDFDLAPGQNVDPTLFDVPAGKDIKLRPRDCSGTTQTG